MFFQFRKFVIGIMLYFIFLLFIFFRRTGCSSRCRLLFHYYKLAQQTRVELNTADIFIYIHVYLKYQTQKCRNDLGCYFISCTQKCFRERALLLTITQIKNFTHLLPLFHFCDNIPQVDPSTRCSDEQILNYISAHAHQQEDNDCDMSPLQSIFNQDC